MATLDLAENIDDPLSACMLQVLKDCDYNVDKACRRTEALLKRSIIALAKAAQDVSDKQQSNLELTEEESREYDVIAHLLIQTLSDPKFNRYFFDLGNPDDVEDLEAFKNFAREMKDFIHGAYTDLLMEEQANSGTGLSTARPRP